MQNNLPNYGHLPKRGGGNSVKRVYYHAQLFNPSPVQAKIVWDESNMFWSNLPFLSVFLQGLPIGKAGWYVAPTKAGDAGNDDSRLLPGFLIRFPVSCSSSLLDQAMLHNITVQALAIYSLLFPQLSESSDQIWLSFLS